MVAGQPATKKPRPRAGLFFARDGHARRNDGAWWKSH